MCVCFAQAGGRRRRGLMSVTARSGISHQAITLSGAPRLPSRGHYAGGELGAKLKCAQAAADFPQRANLSRERAGRMEIYDAGAAHF
jgi:hypothetical protein